MDVEARRLRLVVPATMYDADMMQVSPAGAEFVSWAMGGTTRPPGRLARRIDMEPWPRPTAASPTYGRTRRGRHFRTGVPSRIRLPPSYRVGRHCEPEKPRTWMIGRTSVHAGRPVCIGGCQLRQG